MANELIAIKKNKPAKHPGGRPPAFTNAEDIQVLIDQYFEDCDGKMLTDKETGEPMLNKYDEPIILGAKPYTITGLALALGFNSRVSLLNYEDKPEFMSTIQRAKARVEAYAEARLFDKEGSNGAKFSLANNFKQWKEDRSLDITLTPGQLPAGEVSTLRELEKKRNNKSNQELIEDIRPANEGD